jgi:hypothetical protein
MSRLRRPDGLAPKSREIDLGKVCRTHSVGTFCAIQWRIWGVPLNSLVERTPVTLQNARI